MLALAPSPTTVPHVRRAGRLYVGPFLVPERQFLLAVLCPACLGATYFDDGDFKCLLCARELLVGSISPDGRVQELELRHPRESTGPIRVASGQTRRTARALSKDDGATGLQARVLRLVPYGPDGHTVVEQVSRTLSVRREQVRGALDRLETHGLVERFAFNSGYRIGYRRVPSSQRAGAR